VVIDGRISKDEEFLPDISSSGQVTPSQSGQSTDGRGVAQSKCDGKRVNKELLNEMGSSWLP
jgi:hypothetical protein